MLLEVLRLLRVRVVIAARAARALAGKLEEIRERSAEIQAAAETAKTALKDLEQAIYSANPGVVASVALGAELGVLEWRRGPDRRWGLWWWRGGPDDDLQPVDRMSRAAVIAAERSADALVDAILKALERVE